MDDETFPRRRQTPAEVTARRAARALVASMEDQIGIWQAETIKLQAMAQRPDASRTADLQTAILAQLQAVAEGRASLERSVEAAPEAVRRHNRVTDAQKVLRLLEQRLLRLREEM